MTTWMPVTRGMPDVERLAFAATIDGGLYVIMRFADNEYCVASLSEHVRRWMPSRINRVIERITYWMYVPDIPILDAPIGPFEEWNMPREPVDGWPLGAVESLAQWWEARISRQREIDASIQRKAEYEYLYDKPYQQSGVTRVAGPFSVESTVPTRTFADIAQQSNSASYVQHIIAALRASGVQQTKRAQRIEFVSLVEWPGIYICAEGRYDDHTGMRRAAIMIGAEYSPITTDDLTAAAHEAKSSGFDVLIACAFNFDSDHAMIDGLPIMRARMNADLHMVEALKNTGGGNLFVVFGEPDISIERINDQVRVCLHGVDVYHPTTGKIESSTADEIACWFVDTNYDGKTFWVRQAYFPSTINDPYKALKTTLKADIDLDAWESLRQTVSRPFAAPDSGLIAVKVINHLGDDVTRIIDLREVSG
jgi:adenine-specific DNA-methyltransferase